MSTGGIDEKYLEGLKSGELLLKLTWDEWLSINAPFENIDFSVEDVTVRYHRNGYDWDMHGSLYSPGARSRPASGLRMFPRWSRQRKDHGPHARWQTRFGTGVLLPKASNLSLSPIRATILPEAFGNSPFRSACRFISWTVNSLSKRSKIEI